MVETTKEKNQLPDDINGLTDNIKKSTDIIKSTPETKKDISQYPVFESVISKEKWQKVIEWLRNTSKALFEEYNKKWEPQFFAA